MAQQPKQLTPSASVLDFFGTLVRDLRGRAGPSAAELASRLFVGPDLVRKIEVAERYPSEAFVDVVDEVLGAGGLLREMGPLLAREQTLKSRKRSAPVQFAPEANDSLVLDWLLMDSEGEGVAEAGEAAEAGGVASGGSS